MEAERDRLAAERDSLTSALAAAGEDLARQLEELAAAHAEALGVVETARDEALQAASAALADRDALSAQWAAAEVDRAIRKALERFTFLGATPDLRERAAANFIGLARPDVEAYRDSFGAWQTRVKGGGGSVAAFVAAAAQRHAYLFARLRQPGTGGGGGHIPPGHSTPGTHFGGPPPSRFPAGRE